MFVKYFNISAVCVCIAVQSCILAMLCKVW